MEEFLLKKWCNGLAAALTAGPNDEPATALRCLFHPVRESPLPSLRPLLFRKEAAMND